VSKTLEAAVATLLLVTASVVLACVVVTYAVTSIEQTINTQNIPQIAQLKSFENRLLNETNVMNGPLQQAPSPTP
jgi:predicted PurR-regulated permease PerM